MTVSPRVREGRAPSAHEGPEKIDSIWPWHRLRSHRRVIPIAIALVASILLPLRFLPLVEISASGSTMRIPASAVAEASPLRDDSAVQDPVAGETAPIEAALGDEKEPEEGTIEEGNQAGALFGGSSSRLVTSSRGGARPAPSLGQSIAAAAMEQLGARYRWGGSTPAGFDCSGFTMYVYGQAGIRIPRDNWGQLGSGHRVELDDLRAGDLVFFENTYEWGLSHAGLYLGDNQFIHAESEWAGVVISQLQGSNWGRHYAGASRPYEK